LVSLLDGLCQRYHQRPSKILQESELWEMNFDISIAVKGSQLEKEEMDKEKQTNSSNSGKKFKTGIDGIKHMQQMEKMGHGRA